MQFIKEQSLKLNNLLLIDFKAIQYLCLKFFILREIVNRTGRLKINKYEFEYLIKCFTKRKYKYSPSIAGMLRTNIIDTVNFFKVHI